MSSALAGRLRRMLQATGPVDVARFMALCAAAREGGYYEREETIGAAGDFVTAPEISQIFGEMAGAALAAFWQARGDGPVRIVELGPGRGPLMADLWRAARALPAFPAAVREVVLVETSRRLRALQAQRLAHLPIRHVDSVEEIPDDLPLLVIANEFFDALPVRQFVVTERGLVERLVAVDPRTGAFAFTLAGPARPPDPVLLRRLGGPPAPGTVIEVSPAREAVAERLGGLLAAAGGLLLVFDYGDAAPVFGDSLQAVMRHRKVDPLAHPGEADLSSHVDFGALARRLAGAGARVFGPLAQGAWLLRTGAEVRLARLVEAAPQRRTELEAGLRRLVDPDRMGELFRVLAATGPDDPLPPGFAEDERWSGP